LERIAAWRRVVPDITIRSSFIVGFPGESEADFAQLLDWLRTARLDRVGCFEYSPVEGAAANALGHPQVPPQVKQERRARFMELAAEISAERLAGKKGRTMQVLVDRIDGDVATARSSSDAPEIDGVVRIRGAARIAVGDWARVRISGASAYDLEGKLLA
jgi:ribosomal protein S12 methylthiotransferase